MSPESLPSGIDSWPEALGNRRVRILVEGEADAVRVVIPWRRSDPDPEKNAVLIRSASEDQEVLNVRRLAVLAETGDLAFQPVSGPGEYYVYYLPGKTEKTPFPGAVYEAHRDTADPSWIEKHHLNEGLTRLDDLPRARAIELQSRGEYDRIDPMEIIATEEEIQSLLKAFPQDAFLTFPEDRQHAIRMSEHLPLRWIQSGPSATWQAEAQPGEFLVFQIGVFAAHQDLEELSMGFSDLVGEAGTLPAGGMRCFNLGGTDGAGQPLKKNVFVARGHVQALWVGILVPLEGLGSYRGILSVGAKGVPSKDVRLNLTVSGDPLPDAGDSDPRRLSRLRWLDSTLAQDDEVVQPFVPLVRKGRQVRCLGRSVTFGPQGLPERIVSTFSETLDSVESDENDVLARPVAFVLQTEAGPLEWKSDPSRILAEATGAIVQETLSRAPGISLRCWSKMEADGYLNFQLSLKAQDTLRVQDIRLEIPMTPEASKYMIGMGKEGGLRPEEWMFRWDPARHQDSLWLGGISAGLQCKLKGPSYRWPHVNIHYKHRPLDIPDSWDNGGKGGCQVLKSSGTEVLVKAFSGEREIQAGEELRFDFGLLITPVKPIDYAGHWGTRYYHAMAPASEVVKTGAHVINIHHGTDLHPNINYPFWTVEPLKEYVDQAHASGLRVKLYYTLRELTIQTAEFWPVWSLGNEVYADGPGGGWTWLQEHLGPHYVPAWTHWFPNGEVDAALVTNGLSRWHNYYLEGLDWLVKNVGIDGLYLDDIGYDREIMKRVRKVLDRAKPGRLIDLHSWNHFNDMAGFANCANLYMEHLPYVDSLWIGEGFEYEKKPADYWLIEISGIPFGLMGEMLQGGGNPWRGMVFGMTSRLPWAGDPRPIWKVWDEFGIDGARMLGYWTEACPVRTQRSDVLATAYVRKGQTLVALASWAEEDVKVRLDVDWKALGLKASQACFRAHPIPGFQEEARFHPREEIPVSPGKGWLLLVSDAK